MSENGTPKAAAEEQRRKQNHPGKLEGEGELADTGEGNTGGGDPTSDATGAGPSGGGDAGTAGGGGGGADGAGPSGGAPS